MKRALLDSKQENTICRIGSYSTFTTYLLGPLLNDVMGENQLAVHSLSPGEIEKAILDRVIDIGITSFPVSHDSIHFEQVSEFEMCIYTRRTSFKGVAFEDLPFAVPFMRFSESSIGGQTLDAWPETPSRKIKYYINGLESLLEACRTGLAAAVFPRFVVDLHNRQVKKQYRLEARAFPPKMKRIVLKLFMITRKGDPTGPFHDNLSEMLQRVCSDK